MDDFEGIPKHVAIIMDGNGRWAKKRHFPRTAGHKRGADAAREVIKGCSDMGVEVLTLFAFSSENWNRPKTEVTMLMELFMSALKREAVRLAKKNVRLRIIGERERFSEKLQQRMAEAEEKTAACTGMLVQIAANYGGRMDMLGAVKKIAASVQRGDLNIEDIDEDCVSTYLLTAEQPDPDLFIRTGGESRISNFLLWQLAYAELYFTDVYWPDFGQPELMQAFKVFASRERRFGLISEQVTEHA